jgi:SAM-dependent methyltransferase
MPALAWRSLLKAEAPARFRTVPEAPVASPEVVAKTALMRAEDLVYKSRARVFHATGLRAMADFVRAAKAAGFDLSRADRAFELGCGGARLIRHMRMVRGLDLVASDLIEANVDWCRAHVPGVTFHTNGLQPPLAFLEDESVDFAFAYSVFTHIPYELQRPWALELARILRPGGVATVTILGPDMAAKMMAPEDLAAFTRAGHYTMGPDHPRVSESSARIGSWDVFLTDAEVRRAFEDPLELVSIGRGAQAIVVARKPRAEPLPLPSTCGRAAEG